MGAEPLEAPSDPGDFGFAEDQAAYNAQQAAISELAKGFAAGFGDGSAFDLKDLLVEMAMTPWFRAAASESALDDSDVLRLQAAGIPRLLTASQLMRKTRTLTGLTWGESESYLSPYIKRSQLFFNRLNYGGIDSDGVTRRNYELTAVMADVAIANALNLACPAVALDFARPDVDRRLFAGISPEDTPDTASGVLRNKLVELHWLMLGQSVSPDSAEVQHSYNLLESIYRDRLARNAAEALHDEAIVCDGEEIWQLPWEDWAPDPTHMKASWRAVMAYLMTHYRYLHE